MKIKFKKNIKLQGMLEELEWLLDEFDRNIILDKKAIIEISLKDDFRVR